MKKTCSYLLLLMLPVTSIAQIRVLDRTDVRIQKKQVVLYEHANYTGAFKTLSPGKYLLSDFDDKASSIKVPAGMVAYIYEHAAPSQGYGISVDFLEDVADLSAYNFNDKVSYINVFLTTKDNMYEWNRNSMTGGQFVAGHWERKKARPGPPNTVAVVSPYIEGPLPTTPSVLALNGPNTIINSLGIQTAEGRSLWERAMNNQMGIIGNDYRGVEEIGSACFQRASNNLLIPDFFNFWYPQKQKNDHRKVVYFKRTLAGNLTKTNQVNITGTFEDYDVNLFIKPDPPYQYMLTDAHPPHYTTLMKTQYYGSFTKSGESGCPGKFETIEAEISDKKNPSSGYRSKLIEMNLDRTGKKICVYGPWIWDEGHCRHPEIHPAEQVWWNEPRGNEKKYNLNVVCDASGRFWWRQQMDDGTKLKPWAEPPIKGLFAIAFEYELPNSMAATIGYNNKQFEVTNIQHHNVIEYPNADQTYNLLYDGKNIVSFIPHNNAFKVSFEHIGIDPVNRNKIRGFLVIETSVGVTTQIATSAQYPASNPPVSIRLPEGSDPSAAPQIMEKTFFKKEDGLYFFTVTEKMVEKGRPVIRTMGVASSGQ